MNAREIVPTQAFVGPMLPPLREMRGPVSGRTMRAQLRVWHAEKAPLVKLVGPTVNTLADLERCMLTSQDAIDRLVEWVLEYGQAPREWPELAPPEPAPPKRPAPDSSETRKRADDKPAQDAQAHHESPEGAPPPRPGPAAAQAPAPAAAAPGDTPAPPPASTSAPAGSAPKPKAPQIKFNAIPPELQTGQFFVMWRFVLKKDKHGKPKWTKPPFQINGQYASTTNPATWCTMAEARAALARRNPDGSAIFDGIGRVFSPDDLVPMFGFDLDDCIKPDASGVMRLDPEAQDAIRELGCYAELSPSGEGVHVIGLGFLPGKHFTNNTQGREGYDNSKAGRYLTLTGHVLPGFEALSTPDPTVLAKWHAAWDTQAQAGQTAHAATGTTAGQAGAAYLDVDLVVRGVRARTRALIESLDGLDHYGGDRSNALLGATIELVKARFTDDEIISVLTDPKHAIHTVAQSAGRRSTRDSAAQWIRAYMLPSAHQKVAEQAAMRQASVDIGATGATGLPSYQARVFTLPQMLAQAVYLDRSGQVALRNELRTHYETLELFHKATTASKHQFTRNGRPAEAPASKFWFASSEKLQRQVLTYAPGEGEMCLDPDGAPAFNLWVPRPHSTPVDWQQHVRPFVEHVDFLVPEPDMRGRFLDWLAHIEQVPGTLPHAHFVHVARMHGLGRNWMGSVLARVFAGSTALGFDLGGYLRNGFNGALARKMLVIVDELNESRRAGARSDQEDVLRRTLTETYTTVNPKYGKQRLEKNVKRWLVWSNRPDALPLTTGDRRWNVIRHDGEPRGESYYSRLYAMLDAPLFIASVREFLRQRDIRKFNPGSHAMLNQAKIDMIDAGRSDLERNAALLIAHWPSDLVRSSVAARIVGAETAAFGVGSLHESRPFAAAMRDAGATAGARITIERQRARVWTLRGHDRWKAAAPNVRLAEIERGEKAVPFNLATAEGSELLDWLDELGVR